MGQTTAIRIPQRARGRRFSSSSAGAPVAAPRFPMVALEFDLSPKQLGVLWRLDPDGPGTPMRSIAERLYCDASYVTDLVDRLEERNLIVRTPDPDDRRVKLLELTPAGVELRSKALERLYEPPPGFAELSAAEQRDARRVAGEGVHPAPGLVTGAALSRGSRPRRRAGRTAPAAPPPNLRRARRARSAGLRSTASSSTRAPSGRRRRSSRRARRGHGQPATISIDRS